MFNLGFDSQQLFKAKQKSQLSVWRNRNKSKIILAHVGINHYILEYLSGLMEKFFETSRGFSQWYVDDKLVREEPLYHARS